MFTRAIVRPPAPNFSQGLTTAGLGAPDYEQALQQHTKYCDTLVECGLRVITLAPDEDYADSTFVEDTAVVTDHFAVLTRPGAPSRAGETASMRRALAGFFFLISLPSKLPEPLTGATSVKQANIFLSASLNVQTKQARDS
jgi:dimethylargininase